jgi:sugar phosphate isomerase/epimerase
MRIDRRTFISGVGAAMATLPINAGAHNRSPARLFFERHGLSLGMQIYTLIDQVTADLDGTLRQVGEIGFTAIELAGFLNRTPAQLRANLDGAGLHCTSIHIPAQPSRPGAVSLSGDLSALVADVRQVGATTVVMPRYMFAPGTEPRRADESQLAWVRRVGVSMTPFDWERNADFMNDVGRRLSDAGLRFSYHNQNPEFAPLPQGGTGLEVMLNHTDPALVQFELDAGWAVVAGLDPATLLKAHKGRFAQMHVKDVLPTGQKNYAFVQQPTSVGDGSIDWSRLLPIAYAAGVREFFVEQDPPHQIDPMISLARSYRYLTALTG